MIARSAQLRATFTRRDAWRLAAAAALMVVVLGGVLSIDALPGPLTGPGLIVDDVATVDIRAPRAATFVSEAATEQRRQEVRAQIPPQYDYTPERGRASATRQVQLLETAVAPIDAAFAAVLTPEARAQALRNAMPHLSASARETLAAMDSLAWTSLRSETLRVLDATQRQEVRDAHVSDVRATIGQQIGGAYGADQRMLAAEILAPLIVPNSSFDPAATEVAREEAANRVEPVRFTIRRGEIIVQRGERIDDISREKLQLFGLLDAQPDLARVGGWLLLAGLLVALLLSWVWRFRQELWHRNSALLLIALVLIAATVALKATGDRSLLPYFIPIAAVGLLLAVLLDTTVATVVMAVLAIIGGVVVGTVEFSAYVFLGGLAGVILVRRGERISHFLQAAAGMAVVNVAAVGLFALLGERDVTGMLQLAAGGLVAAAGSAVVAVGSFAVLGNVFGITTSFQLLELANPSQPLLRRLLLETPGTYHHSLMVGNLAERAAEAIGADPLLSRVAAYYHDIGKLANPLAFIENQGGLENVHDELAPEQSAALLKAHIANGIDIAYEHKLPKAIIAFIPQHHGTALMSYFHARAKDSAIEAAGARPGTPQATAAAAAVDTATYRHAGPKPQSREAAILMLADSVEASVRSLTSQDEPTIRAMVERIIRERLEDGQFDECDLTLRDLEKTREAFVAQLLGMYHRRIEYPQNKIVELESRRAAGGGSGGSGGSGAGRTG